MQARKWCAVEHVESLAAVCEIENGQLNRSAMERPHSTYVNTVYPVPGKYYYGGDHRQ